MGTMSKQVIATTHYRRPQYSKLFFDALSRCYGIENYTILISCDYEHEHDAKCMQVAQIAAHFLKTHKGHIFINCPRLGVDLNKLFIMPKAFEISNYVIFLEDDTIPSMDCLRYFEQAGQLSDVMSIAAVLGYNRYTEYKTHQQVLTNEAYAIQTDTGFTPWGWATWKDRYEEIVGLSGDKYKERVDDHWIGEYNGRHDWHWNTYIRNNELKVLYPVLPRVQSVGAEEAEHTPSAQWHSENEYNPYGAWSQKMPDPKPEDWWIK